MSKRLRLALFITILLLASFALVALGYALWPLGDSVMRETLPATLFAPP